MQLRMAVVSLVSVLSVVSAVAASSVACAPRDPPPSPPPLGPPRQECRFEGGSDFVRPGVFATPAASLAEGVTLVQQLELDVDGDGDQDALLDVTAEPTAAREGLVLARRVERGWSSLLLSANAGSLNTSVEWLEPKVAGSVVFIGTQVISDGAREFGPDAARLLTLYVASPPCVLVKAAEIQLDPGQCPCRLEAGGPGRLLVVGKGGRTWDIRAPEQQN
jgi:hypothetical protein